MPFAVSRALGSLGTFVFGEHTMELYRRLIFGRGC
jgi:hypothetical protein